MLSKITIPRERLNECVERICEDYCTYPSLCESQERLKAHCDECPLNNLICDEYWEREEE